MGKKDPFKTFLQVEASKVTGVEKEQNLEIQGLV